LAYVPTARKTFKWLTIVIHAMVKSAGAKNRKSWSTSTNAARIAYSRAVSPGMHGRQRSPCT
jgi:hypothetical protein